MEDLNMTTEVLTGEVVDTETDLADVCDVIHGDLSFLAKLIGFLAGLGAIGSLIASGFGIKKLIDWIKGRKDDTKKSKKSAKAKKVEEEDDDSDDDESDESEE